MLNLLTFLKIHRIKQIIKDNRKKEYSTEIKKVSRKLKKGFEAADMHVDIIV